MTANQTELVDSLYDQLDERRLYAKTVGVTDFGLPSPLAQVRRVMKKCDGALILGLVQGRIKTGTSKPGTSERKALHNSTFPTPWNQLEAGMAYAQGLPLMIVKEVGITVGIFDPGATDRFVHSVKVSTPKTWRSHALTSSLDEWRKEVIRHARAAGR